MKRQQVKFMKKNIKYLDELQGDREKSQKGVQVVQRCSAENKKGAIAIIVFTAMASFWFSTEHLWTRLTRFWLSTDDMYYTVRVKKKKKKKKRFKY